MTTSNRLSRSATPFLFVCLLHVQMHIFQASRFCFSKNSLLSSSSIRATHAMCTPENNRHEYLIF
ncbi:hypothetical protein M758_2G020300 [Ceratodon purpureus]|nr:hypothetical protein M758_2G020300 [Ceratodon purpureus]